MRESNKKEWQQLIYLDAEKKKWNNFEYFNVKEDPCSHFCEFAKCLKVSELQFPYP